ncbi:MAG TPA: ribosome biogenesis GTPase Der [Syntrophales bacterium]|nr:ribosome biogenesis GTPase Der [Syntrophales bacterium]
MKPVIAIIGRPNVGKSTLFNRLVRSRKKAIVIDEPGATRDRNYGEGEWNGRSFLLIDTGGFEPVSTEKILIQMREQTMLAVEEADVILFLLDVRDGLTTSDREIARMLRAVEKPVFYTVNKTDGPKQEALSYEFYGLGVEKIHPISAQHGLGVAELLDDVVEVLPPSDEGEEPEEEDRIRLAVIGKPNVGKSSLVNRILGFERAIVNPIPGTTRDAVDTAFERGDKKYVLIDTAGIRRKAKVSLTLEKYSVIQAIKALGRCDVALLLIDAVEGVTEQDAKIAGLALEEGRAVIIVVNKWDAIEKDNATVGEYVRKIQETLKFMDFAPILFVSALSGQRVARIFEAVDGVYEQYTRRVNTALVNDALRAVITRNPPPMTQGRANTVAYVTQAAIRPPTFIFFMKDPKGVHFSYQRFLVNQIRETLGFTQVPVRVFFKRKSK